MRPESGSIHNFRHNERLTPLCIQAKMCATKGGATARSLGNRGYVLFDVIALRHTETIDEQRDLVGVELFS